MCYGELSEDDARSGPFVALMVVGLVLVGGLRWLERRELYRLTQDIAALRQLPEERLEDGALWRFNELAKFLLPKRNLDTLLLWPKQRLDILKEELDAAR